MAGEYEEIVKKIPLPEQPIGPLAGLATRLDYLGPKVVEISPKVAELGEKVGKLESALRTLQLTGEVAPTEGVVPVFDEQLQLVLKQLRDFTLSEFWYSAFLKIYELEKTERVGKYGFLVEADVAPGTSYVYNLDLTSTNSACICPKFVACCDLGVYGKLTNLVNESPVDAKLEEKRPGWIDKYPAVNLPLPTDIPHSLHLGWDYVVFPKRKVQVTFTNDHPTQTAHFVFYADYLEIEFDPYAIWLTENIYVPLVERLKQLILPG